MTTLTTMTMMIGIGTSLFGCVPPGHDRGVRSPPPAWPVTVYEDTIYDSPFQEVRRVRTNDGRTIRYERRLKDQ